MAIHLASCLRCHTFSQNVRQTYSLPSQTPQTVAERVAISEGREWERYMCSLHIHKPALIVHGYQSVEPVGCAVWSPHAFLRHYAWPGGNSTTTCPAVLASSGDLPYKEPARPPQVGVNHIPTWAYVTGLPEASAGLRRGRYTHTQSTHHESKSTFKHPGVAGCRLNLSCSYNLSTKTASCAGDCHSVRARLVPGEENGEENGLNRES